MEQKQFPQNPYGQKPVQKKDVPPNQAQFSQFQQNMGQQPFPPNQNPKNLKGNKQKKNKKFITLGIFAAIGLILGGIVFAQVNKYAKAMTIINLPGAPIIDDSGKLSLDNTNATIEPDADVNLDMSQLTTVKGEAWNGSTRITCLAMGMDYRDWEAGEEYSRTDSMMLLTYDPITEMAGMLSIPRDLWVAIPNHGYGRINTAYFLGEAEKLPGGGPQLATDTVELLLGIDIQYYAVISFDGFVDFIDSIDKLAINVKEGITVDPIGPGNTVTLLPGVQDLDGKTALAYARYRYSSGGDFERAQRQQDVIYALYEQMVWQLPQMLMNADQLFASLSKALITNLTFNDMMKIAWTVVDLQPYQIAKSVIAPPYQVEYGTTSDGTQQILIPIPDKIREARDVIFSTSVAASPVTVSEDQASLIAAEGAKISLVNGSSNAEIMDRTIAYLQSFGITIVSTGQGSNAYYNSLEINSGKPFTAQFLKDLMAIPVGAITMNYIPNNNVDLVLTITDAWVTTNPM
jgi:LCP family protein required for cell wall assembly